MTKTAIFAAGCFWGIEEKFLSTDGVVETEVGYIGGKTSSPTYQDVCLDIYDFLREQIEKLVKSGMQRKNIIVDPGIGFGKTLKHNVDLLRRISLFHGLGVPILIGVSRKKFIKTIAELEENEDRLSGSVSVALFARSQGVQIFRVHDVKETVQAMKLWHSIHS